MLIIDKKILIFNFREVHFSDKPFDIDDCDFLNFHYCKNEVNVKGFTCKKKFTIVIDLTQDLDIILQNIKVKNDVSRQLYLAKKEGIRIRKNEGYDQFFKMYRSFIQKKGIKSLFDIFGVGSITLESMKKNGTLFVAEYNGEIIYGTLYLEDNSHIKSWISASKRFELDSSKKKLTAAAKRLIDLEAIKYAKGKGIKEYDLGGIWSEEETEKDATKKSINTFKLRLGGKIVTRYSYQKSYSKTCTLVNYLYCLKNLNR